MEWFTLLWFVVIYLYITKGGVIGGVLALKTKVVYLAQVLAGDQRVFLYA
jgi:hypothetical protein